MNLAQPLIEHRPTKDFFVGIDSDGCAIDAMDIKHYECFTPCYIKYFDLQPISSLVRETAIFVNLLSTTRGMNRWVTLDLIFDRLKERPEVLERGVVLPEGTQLKAFLASGLPLSAGGIRQFADAHPSGEIERCIAWGEGVNRMVEWMVHGCAPFPGVREAFELMSERADLMTVSAASTRFLEREWAEHGLDRYMQVMAGQEMGTKADHLRLAAKDKYDDDHILLIGDAPGDRAAAAAQGVAWYPIIPGQERQSWERLRVEAFDRFLSGSYRGEYEDSLMAEYDAVLLSTPPWKVIG
ncbi:HAD family hydrolase [Trueperella pyogenes]|uniref:HAD family hydrolase n=1 Tax=Trueperella pyogenes TaxID=1661 RepID=UPI00345CEE13